MLGKKLRRTLIVAVAILIAATLTAFFFLSNPAPQTTFYRDRDGLLIADIRPRAKTLQLPFIRFTGVSVSPNLRVWRDGEWREDHNHFRNIRWSREFGYRARITVPDEKWRIEMRCAPKRAFRLGALNFALPFRTNLVFSLEFPSRRELEKQYPPPKSPEESPTNSAAPFPNPLTR
jgi:hypothetical protein